MTKTQVEVITSVQRRRRWSRGEKERIVAAYASGEDHGPALFVRADQGSSRLCSVALLAPVPGQQFVNAL